MNWRTIVMSAAASLLLPLCALADSISPTALSASLDVGESLTITKTVTVVEGGGSPSVDVFFLADETGSMAPYINAIKASASSILASVAALGDLNFGVGGYRDTGDAFVYRELTDLTASQATAQTAINAWQASGGGDYPEAAMYALSQVASQTTWRSGSERLVVWFGDAPADIVDVGGVTQAGVISQLNALGISVLAINVGTNDFFAPTGVGFRGLNDRGQASAIATGTGGEFYDGIDSASIVATITDAITNAVLTYSTVGIDTSEVPAGIGISVSPLGYAGSYDRSVTRNFSFDVTFTGLAAGTYSFNLYGTVDGGRVATERDYIVVGGGTPVPEPGTIGLLGLGLLTMGMSAVRRRRSM